VAIKKVIVIGLDGLEPTIVEPMIASGELPNLAKLAARGGYARVATTSPAQTPVAWATFATGVNPGGHGIFDFLTRNPQTYLPDLALNRYEQPNAFLPPKAVNRRRGVPVWATLSEAGIPSTILRCPCTYPPDPIRGRLLSGLGTPDLRGGFGTSTFYTTDLDVKAGESELVVPLTIEGDTIATHLIGPRHPKTRADCHAALTMLIDRERRCLELRVEGAANGFRLGEGQWSEWQRVTFKTGLFQKVHGLIRFYAQQIEPRFALLASPIQFDPETPLFPISSPPDYASELAARIGPFATAGMIENHAALSNGRINEDAFLDQCQHTWCERQMMMVDELSRFDEGLFFCLFDTPDRVQHMFWRFREPGHPALLGKLPESYSRVIEDHYRIADTMVGNALGFADDETLVIALSDHGFNSFQRGFHLNTWLHDQGLLALEPGVEPGAGAGDLLRHVDWSRTRAYALGLSGIYLNQVGREAHGIVAPEDAESLKAAIARGLRGLRDPERNAVAVRRVLPREELYHGPYVAEAPDLAVHFAEGYRVSWDSVMGGLPAGHFEDNIKPWSGDHLIDPTRVPGVLFLNRPYRMEGANLLDLAPTILTALGCPAGPALEGRSLWP
jgi:predicted AlkP superfamily phosphohydrolase/phosphomutase